MIEASLNRCDVYKAVNFNELHLTPAGSSAKHNSAGLYINRNEKRLSRHSLGKPAKLLAR